MNYSALPIYKVINGGKRPCFPGQDLASPIGQDRYEL